MQRPARKQPAPADNTHMGASDVTHRFCKLMGEVSDQLQRPTGCFCGKGFGWTSIPGFDGTYAKGFRSDSFCLEFIEQAVREKLKTLK